MNLAGGLQTTLTSMHHLTSFCVLTNIGVCRRTLPQLLALQSQCLQFQQRNDARALVRMVAVPQPNLSSNRGDCEK